MTQAHTDASASNAQYDIVAVGSATEDVMVHCSDARVITLADQHGQNAWMAFEYGGKIHVDDMTINVGGGSVNTAITFAKQHMKTAMISRVGRDEPGNRVRGRMEELGVDTHLMAWSETSKTGYSTIITTFTGERTILVHRGAARELGEDDIAWEQLRHTEWMYVGALAGQSWRLYPKLARFAGEHGIKLAINLGTSQIDQGLDEYGELLAHTHLIFQNVEEMRLLTGVEAEQGDRDEREICRRLHERGVDIVVITDGPRGATASDGRAYYTVPAYEVEIASTVGAGDAFAAGCISALWRGKTVPESLRLAAANAASVCAHAGANAGILTWEEALQFVDERKTRS
ncbi:MAG: carbohydrate kinase family protein [Armatimonadota bacterium]|jgi:ribokinase